MRATLRASVTPMLSASVVHMGAHLANVMNSTKDAVGRAQLWRVDHVPVWLGIGGRDTQLAGRPYMRRNAARKAVLRTRIWVGQSARQV